MTRSTKKSGTQKAGRKKVQVVHIFNCSGLLLTLPREDVARTKILTRKKRVLPDGYDEAVKIFEEKLEALTAGQALTPEIWGGRKNLKKQADLKAAAAVLLSFGVSAYPVPADQEAAARALADPDEDAKTESPKTPAPAEV